MRQFSENHAAPPTAAGATGAGDVSPDFVHALLAALTEMAVLSPRRQADVAVASLRAGLAASPELLARAVDILYREGCIERPLHLSDGGILASVTMRGIEVLSTSGHRHVVARLMDSDTP
jgi:hypothetical protein